MKRTWPDGTPKSRGNAFDWRNSASQIVTSREFRQSQASAQQMAGKGKTFTIYSRAKPKGKV